MNGNIKNVSFNDKLITLNKEDKSTLSQVRLEPVSATGVWILVGITTSVICYIGYKTVVTIKKYMNKKTKNTKTKKTKSKTGKKCGSK
jgi:hypothetical protein